MQCHLNAPQLQTHIFSVELLAQDTLGKTSIAFSTIPATGQWLHRRDALVGKSMVTPAQGELEYEVMLESNVTSMAQGHSWMAWMYAGYIFC